MYDRSGWLVKIDGYIKQYTESSSFYAWDKTTMAENIREEDTMRVKRQTAKKTKDEK